MIIVPIVLDYAAPGVGTGTTPTMDRLDYPDLKAGDLVGVIRRESSSSPSVLKWCAYVYVVPEDSELYYPGTDLRRHWGFSNCGFATTKWGAKRKLARMVRLYRDGVKHEVQQIAL